MTDTMTLAPAEGTWVVRAGGAVLGETTRALAVTKPDGACVIYFPKDDIGMAFLEQSTPTLVETDEGQVLFFSIVAKSRTYENAAWSLALARRGAG